MVFMNNTLTGTWHSRYGYIQGANQKPYTSDHRIEFTQEGELWVGRSVTGDDGSAVTLIVRQNGNEFKGEWRERTSPTGHYQGREFTGVILLVLQPAGAELKGMWLGVDSSVGGVKSGIWLLKREA